MRKQAVGVYRQHMDIMVKKYDKNRLSHNSKKKLRKSGGGVLRASQESQEERKILESVPQSAI